MSELKVDSDKSVEQVKIDQDVSKEKFEWETPTIEDVSEEVMAQPYIRFT